MSVTTALAVKPNSRPLPVAEFHNAWGWAPRIWNALLGHSFLFDDPGLHKLWRGIETLPTWQQVPLVLTFDTGVIPRSDMMWAAEQLEEFDRRLPAGAAKVNHVPAMAALMRSAELDAPWFGVWGTSVSENPFEPWDLDRDGPGSGVSLDQMYVLARHRHFPEVVAPQ